MLHIYYVLYYIKWNNITGYIRGKDYCQSSYRKRKMVGQQTLQSKASHKVTLWDDNLQYKTTTTKTHLKSK